MNSIFKIVKEVAKLPTSLEKDTIYAVRAGVGFDLYISDTTGSIAYKVNSPIDPSVLYTKTDVNQLLTSYALKSDLPSLATYVTSAYAGVTFATYASLTSYAKLTDLPDMTKYLTVADAGTKFALSSSVYDKASIDAMFAGIVSTYNLVTTSVLSSYYTSVQVDNLLTSYAKKTDLPNLASYVTTAYADATYALASNTYTKTQVDTARATALADYLKTADFNTAIANYVTSTALTTKLASYYTRTASDARFPLATNVYSKADVDAMFAGIVPKYDLVTNVTLTNYYSRSEVDDLLSNYLKVTDFNIAMDGYDKQLTMHIQSLQTDIDTLNGIIPSMVSQTILDRNYYTSAQVDSKVATATQTLSLSGSTLSISSGNSVTLSSNITGSGSPEGVVKAAAGTVYFDTAMTNGAMLWLKTTASTLSTGWIVTKGDTGWRVLWNGTAVTAANVTTTGTGTTLPSAGRFLVRRTNHEVFWFFDGLNVVNANSGKYFMLNFDDGFYMDVNGSAGTTAAIINSNAPPATVMQSTKQLKLLLTANNFMLRDTKSFLAYTGTRPWPAELPGVAG